MTGNYNYGIKNTTAVWNLTPPANLTQYLNSMLYIKHQSRFNRHTLSLCVNFRVASRFGWHVIHQASKWIQQNNRQLDITSRAYIYTQQIDNKILQYPRQREKPLILVSAAQIRKTKITRYILAPLQLMSTYYKTCIIHPIALGTM